MRNPEYLSVLAGLAVAIGVAPAFISAVSVLDILLAAISDQRGFEAYARFSGNVGLAAVAESVKLSYAVAVLLGLPLFLLLRLRGPIRWYWTVLAGALAGAVGSRFLTGVFGALVYRDLALEIRMAVVAALYGTVSGLAFWLIYRHGRRKNDPVI